jgi:hypothetical protein
MIKTPTPNHDALQESMTETSELKYRPMFGSRDRDRQRLACGRPELDEDHDPVPGAVIAIAFIGVSSRTLRPPPSRSRLLNAHIDDA